MNDPKYKVVEGVADTAHELIKLLSKVPKDYAVSLAGMNTFAVLMDEQNHTVLIDDVNFIEELLEEYSEKEEKD